MCKIVALIKIQKTQLNKRGEAAIENSKYTCVLTPPHKKKKKKLHGAKKETQYFHIHIMKVH